MAGSDSERPLFAQGLAVPVKADASGGFARSKSDNYISQIIETNAGDTDSENPFQIDLGAGIQAVFANVSEGAFKALQKRKIEQIFKNLSAAKLATLKSISFRDREEGEPEGNFYMIVKWRSLETNTDQEVETTLRKTG